MNSLMLRLLVFQAVLSGSCLSQILPFHTYGAKDGLPRDEVRTLCQDERGFLWLGTTEGLVQFDGATFTPHILPGGLTANFINNVVTDDSGDLWIATNYNGIVRQRGGAFTRIPLIANDPDARANRANAILALPGGDLVVGTDDGLFRYHDGAFERIRPSEPTLRKGISRLLRDHDGTLWVGTFDGLCSISPSQPKSTTFIASTQGSAVNALAADRSGTLWIGTDKGLRTLSFAAAGAPPRLRPLPHILRTLGSTHIRSLLIDNSGTVWIGTESEGVSRYDTAGALASYAVGNGLPGNSVQAIMEDREQDLWLATNAGLCKLSQRYLVNYALAGGLERIGVTSITEDRSGRMWFGTQYGLACLDRASFSAYSAASGLGSSYILCLLTDSRGAVWAGTGDGLSLLQSSPGSDRFRTFRPEVFVGPSVVRTLHEDRRGRLWFGTTHWICSLSGNGIRSHALEQTAADELLLAIVTDNASSLWVGTQDDGIYRFLYPAGDGKSGPLKEIAHYRVGNGLVDGNIRSGLRDADGNLWFGTRRAGVEKLLIHGDSVAGIVNYSTDDGLSGNWVRSILQDRAGAIWLATNRGVDRLTTEPSGRIRVRTLMERDGIAGDEVLACYEDTRGDLWFGASLGVTRYSPSADLADTVVPAVLVTRVRVLGQEDTAALRSISLSLSADQHSVSFEYIGISFKDETRVRYRYMLEGLDPGWSQETDRHYVNYTHLPPGRYVFRVTACNADGVWSTVPAQLAFSIAAPFWETWWFIGMALFACAGSVYGVARFRRRRIRELERVRSKIAADLHDDLGSTLSSISIFSEMARREAGLSGAAPLIARIGESAHAMLESLDDIVWAIHPENDSLEDILVRMRTHAAELLEARGITFQFDLPEDFATLKLRMDVRKQLYLVFKEAVNNIVRHSGCTRVVISVRRAGDEILLVVSDNGKGFVPGVETGGDGLRNMRTRSAAMGGTALIDSAPGKGTTVTVRLRIT